jgi:hypothetical protein
MSAAPRSGRSGPFGVPQPQQEREAEVRGRPVHGRGVEMPGEAVDGSSLRIERRSLPQVSVIGPDALRTALWQPAESC